MWQSTVLVPVGLARVILRRLITNDKLQTQQSCVVILPAASSIQPPSTISVKNQRCQYKQKQNSSVIGAMHCGIKTHQIKRKRNNKEKREKKTQRTAARNRTALSINNLWRGRRCHYSSDNIARVQYAAAKRRPQHKPIRFLRPVAMTFDVTRGPSAAPRHRKTPSGKKNLAHLCWLQRPINSIFYISRFRFPLPLTSWSMADY